jgi:hypothetical protein
MPEVLSRSSYPILTDFAGGKGTPIVVNTVNGRGYVLTDSNAIVPLNGIFVHVDDHSSLQAAVNACIAAGGGTVYWDGDVTLTQMLEVYSTGSVINVNLVGSNTLRSRLIWNGSTSGTAVRIRRNVRFELANFSIVNAVAAGTTTGLNLTSETSSGSDTGPAIFRNVRISGFNKNYVVGATGAGNSASEISYHSFELDGGISHGAEINGANSLNHTFYHLNMTSCAVGLEVVDPDCCYIYGGSATGQTTQDFAFRPAGTFIISGYRTEGAERFLTVGPNTGNGAGSATNLTVVGCRIADTVAADNQAIRLNKSGNYIIHGNHIQDGHVKLDAGNTVYTSLDLTHNLIKSTTDLEITPGSTLYAKIRKFGNNKDNNSPQGFWPSGEFFMGSGAAIEVPTFTDADTSPSVLLFDKWKASNTGATTITTFDDGSIGQEITVLFTNANTTISEAGNIKLSAAFTSSADDAMKLIYDGTNWYELSRSVN